MSRDELLTERTYKNQGHSIGARIHYTLDCVTHDPKPANTLLALLIQRLTETGVLSENDIDSLLLDLLLLDN